MIPNKLNISAWTRTWIKNQNSIIMQETGTTIKKKETPRHNHQSWIPQTQTHFTCSRNERVPVNTPASGQKHLFGTFDQTLNRQMTSRGNTGKCNSKQGQFGFRVWITVEEKTTTYFEFSHGLMSGKQCSGPTGIFPGLRFESACIRIRTSKTLLGPVKMFLYWEFTLPTGQWFSNWFFRDGSTRTHQFTF